MPSMPRRFGIRSPIFVAVGLSGQRRRTYPARVQSGTHSLRPGCRPEQIGGGGCDPSAARPCEVPPHPAAAQTTPGRHRTRTVRPSGHSDAIRHLTSVRHMAVTGSACASLDATATRRSRERREKPNRLARSVASCAHRGPCPPRPRLGVTTCLSALHAVTGVRWLWSRGGRCSSL